MYVAVHTVDALGASVVAGQSGVVSNGSLIESVSIVTLPEFVTLNR